MNPSHIDIFICQHNSITNNLNENTGRFGRFGRFGICERDEESCAMQDKNMDGYVGHADLYVVVSILRLLLHT